MFNLLTSDVRRLGVVVVATLVFIFYSGEVSAVTRTWDGGGADNNWSTAANWSSDTAPTSADDVVFDGTSVKDSVMNSNHTIRGFNASSTYTGALNIANGNTLSVNSSWTYNAANFNAGTSTLKLMCSASNFTPGTVNYYNINLAKANGCGNYIISGTATTTNDLIISDGNMSVNSGNINVQGNIIITASSFNGGSATTTLNGTGNQTLLASNTGKLPVMVVNKSSGTLYLNGSINLQSNWIHTAGTIDAGTSTLRFSGSATQYFTGGTEIYNTIEFAKPQGGGNLYIVGTATTTNFTTAADASNGTVLNGTLNIIGDINITSSNFSGGDANAVFNIDGTGNQTISSAGGELPNITINKPSGSLYLQSTIPLDRNWTYTIGTVDAGTSTLKFVGGVNQTFTPGTVNYYNLELAKPNGTGSLTVSGTATTTNDFINSNGTNNSINTGTVNVGGDIMLTTTAGLGGTATINMNGAGNQGISSSGAKLPTLSINKSTGQTTIDSNLTVEDNLNITTGELLINTTTTMTVTGATAVSSGGTWTNYQATSTIFFGSTVTNNGTINFNGGGSSCGDADTLYIRSTAASQRSWSGSGTFNIQDASVQYQAGSASITVYSGTNVSNNGANWTFDSCPISETVSCSASTSTTAFGTLTDGAVSTSTPNITITMSCTYSGGCTLSVLDAGSGSNPGLWNSTSSALIESSNAAYDATSTLLAGTEGYGIQATMASGTTLAIAPRYAQTGDTVGGLTLSAITLASSTAALSGDETVQVKHKAAIAASTPAGNYNDTIIYGCIGN